MGKARIGSENYGGSNRTITRNYKESIQKLKASESCLVLVYFNLRAACTPLKVLFSGSIQIWRVCQAEIS